MILRNVVVELQTYFKIQMSAYIISFPVMHKKY